MSDSSTKEAATGIVPTFRPGGQYYGESIWRVPFKVIAVLVSAVVDTAAEIAFVAQGLYDKMS